MDSLFAVKYSYLIPLLPLLGAAVAGFFGAKWLKGQSHWPIWIGVGASAVLSFVLLAGMLRLAPHHGPDVQVDAATGQMSTTPAGHGDTWQRIRSLSAVRYFYTWIEAGTFRADAAFLLDPLSAVMLCVVCGIGFLITVFAAGYMKGEAGYFRFFAYLGLFIFAMTILVMGDNFVMLYLGWEGVGLCSYLLIGYYYDKPAAREAAKKAFLVNRIGDFGFGLGIMLIYVVFGTVCFFGTPEQPGALVQAMYPSADSAWKAAAIHAIPFLLMLGAFGKSAQFPLHVWLPDAMEGPTPVSALIHAATMVTAGVYMIVRCSTLFFPNAAAMTTIGVIGAFTALFAALIAMRQFDLKKVFAYSTVSQLGFMFVGVAVLAPVAAMFHLITHAFFKALLFLSSGVVMHAMAGELDMRRMSGLKNVLPKTRWLMLVGCLALAGVPFFSGFFSKDEILIAAFRHGKDHPARLLLGLVMAFTALLTAYYTFRLYFRVFHGPEVIPSGPAPGHGHDAADAHAHASAAAVHSGSEPESGVDRHLTDSAAGHGPAAHAGHDAHDHDHEPPLMILPLVVLAAGAFLVWVINVPGHQLGHFLEHSPSLHLAWMKSAAVYGADQLDPAMFGRHDPDAPSHLPMMILSGLIALLGILLAYLMHLKDRPRSERLAARFGSVTRLLEAKFWVDEVYQRGIVEPLRGLGRVFFAIDRYVVDGVVWLIGFVPQVFGFGLKLTTQRGSLQGYAVMMVLGVALILLFILM